jgi:hypothetical protein
LLILVGSMKYTNNIYILDFALKVMHYWKMTLLLFVVTNQYSKWKFEITDPNQILEIIFI